MRRALPLVLVVCLSGCGSEPVAARVEQVVGVEWELRSLTVDGTPMVGAAEVYVVVRFDGRGHYSAKTCNYLYGDVSFDGTRLRLSNHSSTLMACSGGVAAVTDIVDGALVRDPSWSLEGGLLRLESDGVVAEFGERDPPYPSRDVVVLDEAEVEPGGARYMFGYRPEDDGSTFLVIESRDASGEPWGSGGMLAEYGPEVMAVSFGDAVYVMGYTPPTTARAEYHLDGRGPVAFSLYPLPGGLMAFGGVGDDIGGQVVAFDAGGREVGRSRPVP